MSIAEVSIRHKVTTWMFMLVLAVAGYMCYYKLGWLEDPEFTIKEAIVSTQYPGATAEEVEQEVTNPLEDAIQQLKQLKYLKYSISKPGLSIIDAEMQDKYDKNSLPIIWQQLRNKVSDHVDELPPGAGVPLVNDDFGDVYGVLYALVAPGFTWREMKDYGDFLRKELVRVDGVAKVIFWGEQQEVIYIEISRARLSEMGFSPDFVINQINSQNLVTPAGKVLVGTEYINIFPTGEYLDYSSIGDTLLVDPATGVTFRLSDLATVKKSYVEPAVNLMSYTAESYNDKKTGKPQSQSCLGIGISAKPDANVVQMGNRIKQRLAELENQRPLGMRLESVVFQGDAVDKSVKNFVNNLVMAVIIVVAVLLIFMGLRCGILIGVLLLLIVASTFVCMYIQEITLQRISLGALIIALGMLVDNGIVVADGMLVNIKRGMDKISAASLIVKQTTLPLLGGTLVGILAFSAIGLSPDSTGEYCGSLFWVICYSMLWSWIMAITVVPLLGNLWFKSASAGDSDKDPYDTAFYRFYRGVLSGLIRFRLLTIAVLIGALLVAFWGFGYVDRTFFPESDSPRFYIDMWAPQGADIRAVDQGIRQAAEWIMGVDPETGQKRFPEAKFVSTYAGSGAPRFTLTYSAQQNNSSYGFIMVEVDSMDKNVEDDMFPKLQEYMDKSFPTSLCKIMRFKMGASYDATIEARFLGPDADILRKFTDEAMRIMRKEPLARYIQTDWRQREKVIRPEFSEARARFAGVSRAQLCDAFQQTYIGTTVGVYREKNNLIPIMVRPTEQDRNSVDDLYFTTVWSDTAQKYLPVQQIVSGFATEWQDTIIRRRYGIRCMIAQCEPISSVSGPTLLDKLNPKIQELVDRLPPGYSFEWGGQKESSGNANAGLMKTLPISFLIMGMIVIMLYDAVKQTVVIYLNVPLALIGVTVGLLATNMPFGFMAMLGFLSLSGMMIKNAIVLVDQIDQDIASGKTMMNAILDSGVSRVRPVALGAATTVLGMLPLIADPFFNSMAVTICFGLTFATVLTLLICPVLYSLIFRVKWQKDS